MKTHNKLVEEFKNLHDFQHTDEYCNAMMKWVESEKRKFVDESPKIYVAFSFYMGGYGIAEAVSIGDNLLWVTEYNKLHMDLGLVELNHQSILSFDETLYGQYITLISQEEYNNIAKSGKEIERNIEPSSVMGDVAGSNRRLGIPEDKSDEANDLIFGKGGW